MAVVRPTWSVLAGVVAAAPVAIASAATLDIAMVRVGNAGNGADPLTGLGAVPYEYYIGTTEVTNAQYAAFLNAVDPSGVNPHDLYNPNMTNATGFAVVKGGIDLVPEAVAGSKYAPKQNYANKPVNYVSFHDAARFANWLMTGDTESNAGALHHRGKRRTGERESVWHVRSGGQRHRVDR
ncbi:MAG: SUMF1/EgtB/PvdO family nonheme iron enzyme [Betaproteobacteria bacterium]|nr:SUMF1/EgtB/PvdO family nonheme iron enzyme [Betaproteobacteria bacterium]